MANVHGDYGSNDDFMPGATNYRFDFWKFLVSDHIGKGSI